jgi:hypothetical protein
MPGSSGTVLPSKAGWWTEPRRDALWTGAISFLFALLLISQVICPLKGLTGDEPHYLMVAHSLVSDGDLNLRDDYVEEQAWRAFYTGQTLPPHYAPGLNGFYSTRMIGLGVYLAPFYLAGTVAGNVVFWARLGVALLYCLLMANIYLLCRQIELQRDVSIAAWLFGAFSVPLAFYSYSIYPEIPVALLSVLALRMMITWDGASLRQPFLIGLCLALMPWLGVKYAAIVVALAVTFIVLLVRKRAAVLRPIAAFLAVPLLAAVCFALFLYLLYGVVNPAVIYTGVGENAKALGGVNLQAIRGAEGFPPPLGDYLRVSLMYFFDQRDGILFYSPVYLFGIAGLIMLVGRRLPAAGSMLSVFVVYWVVYALSGWSSGHAPAGRPMAAVIWVLVVGMAAAYERARSKLTIGIRVVLSSFTLAFFAILVANNDLIYHVLLGHTEAQGNNLLASIPGAFDFSLLFPNLFNPNDIHPIPTVLFIALAVTIVLVLLRSGGQEGTEKQLKPGPLLVLLCAGIPLLLMGAALVSAELIPDEELQGGGAIRIAFRDVNTYGFEPVDAEGPIGFWVMGGKTARVDLICAKRPEKLHIDLHSRVAQTVELLVEGTLFKVEFERPRWQRVDIPGTAAVPWKGRILYRITVASPSGSRPSSSGEGEAGKADTRFLGCRVAISTSD